MWDDFMMEWGPPVVGTIAFLVFLFCMYELATQ